MKSITLTVHPLALAAIIAVAVPTVAIAAGTILTPPVSVSGSSSSSLFVSTNSGSGAAIQGTSTSGKGVLGQTKSKTATNLNNGQAGVTGQDQSTIAFNAGVRGFSNKGLGVYGISTSGTGVMGQSTSGNGLVGQTETQNKSLGSGTQSGVEGQDLTSAVSQFCGYTNPVCFVAGVVGTSENNIGIIASGPLGLFANGGVSSFTYGGTAVVAEGAGNGNDGTGIAADGTLGITASGYCINTGNCGVDGTGGTFSGILTGSYSSGSSCCEAGIPVLGGVGAAGYGPSSGNPDDFGVYGESPDGIGGWVQSDASPSPGFTPAPAFVAQGNGGATFVATTNNVGDVASIDGAGNMILKGSLVQGGTPLIVSRDAAGALRGRFSNEETMPTIEDVGEAQLSNGQAFVPLDTSFQRVIDGTRAYLVFITPDGDANSLFVSQKSFSGFYVRESHGGRSSITFDYRIIAHPYHGSEARLPTIAAMFPQADPRITKGLAQIRARLHVLQLNLDRRRLERERLIRQRLSHNG